MGSRAFSGAIHQQKAGVDESGLALGGYGFWRRRLRSAPMPALAQDAATQAAPGDTPATDAIGPRDLQNFTLNGTVNAFGRSGRDAASLLATARTGAAPASDFGLPEQHHGRFDPGSRSAAARH